MSMLLFLDSPATLPVRTCVLICRVSGISSNMLAAWLAHNNQIVNGQGGRDITSLSLMLLSSSLSLLSLPSSSSLPSLSPPLSLPPPLPPFIVVIVIIVVVVIVGRWMGGSGMTRGNGTTSRIRGVRLSRLLSWKGRGWDGGVLRGGVAGRREVAAWWEGDATTSRIRGTRGVQWEAAVCVCSGLPVPGVV